MYLGFQFVDESGIHLNEMNSFSPNAYKAPKFTNKSLEQWLSYHSKLEKKLNNLFHSTQGISVNVLSEIEPEA